MKGCPYCAESIQDAATVCRYCSMDLVTGQVREFRESNPPLPESEKARIRSRIRSLNLWSFALWIPGFVLQIVGRVMLETKGEETAPLGCLMLGVSVVLMLSGLSAYARMKGRSGTFGLLGFLSCIGLIILALLGKCCHNCRRMASHSATECANCGAPM